MADGRIQQHEDACQASDARGEDNGENRKRCPACGHMGADCVYIPDSAAKERFLHLSRLKYGGFMDGWVDLHSLEVLRCPECGHYFYADIPDQQSLFAMYAASRPLRPKASGPPARSVRKLRAMCNLLTLCPVQRSTRTKLLDYGSGFGSWVMAAIKAGFSVTAYEPSQSRALREALPAEVRLVHSLDEILGEHFDAVNLEQVLEHVPDPVGVLKGLRVMCSPGAPIRITVPHAGRVLDRPGGFVRFPFDGQSLHILSPYEHVQGFTPCSLRALLARCGLREVGMSRLIACPSLLLRRAVGRVAPRLDSTWAIAVFTAGSDRKWAP